MKRLILLAVLFSIFDIWGSYTLTIVSYNVGAFNKYVRNSSPEVAEMMNEVRADVIGLCEIDSCSIVRNNRRNQLAEFVAQMGQGWFGHFGKAMSFGGGGYGVGAVTSPRFRVRESYTVALPKGKGSEPRAAAVVETDRFIFACAHLDYADAASRLRQAEVISEKLVERHALTGKPVILCGDMNAAPDSPTMDYFRQNWDIVSPYGLSFPSDNPRACIDYIMVLRGSCVYNVYGRAGVRSKFKSGNPRTASDHLPVVVKLRLH
ncbi:MAG: endonuclease/exonuclease/phosphatase family protein [Bacteroidales bacterium]|nr:endonuclease/exonuclease/phosphatase family protein [Bacteroidales bacterium]